MGAMTPLKRATASVLMGARWLLRHVARGARWELSAVAAFDEAEADVSATICPDPPWIVEGTKVAFWLLAGAARSRYKIVVTAPTQQGELLTAVAMLAVTP